MDHDALKLLQDTAIRADGQNLILGVAPHMVHVTKGDEKLESLERFATARSRFRGTMSTSLLAQFIAHFAWRVADARAYEGENPLPFRTFVNPDALAATSFFNVGTKSQPGHCDDKAVLTLKPLAAYQALLNLAKARHSQRELAEFVEEWAPNLRAWGEGPDAIWLGAVVTSIRKVTVKAKSEVGNEARNHGATRTTLEALDAQGEGELPVFLDFTTGPYPGFQIRTFRLRLATLTSGDAPTFTLRIVNKEQHDEDIANEFCALLGELAVEPHSLTIGAFDPK